MPGLLAHGADMTISRAIAVLMATFAICDTASAINLGNIGPTYPIVERNLLEHIQESLREKERTGELKRMQEKAKASATQSIMNPKPVPGLGFGLKSRTFYFDPTLVLDRNIVDERGAILFPAGTRKNPLDVVTLSKHLLFFDARDPKQVAKAVQLTDFYKGKVKPILVGGSYIELMKTWGRPVYYDQQGSLVKKFGITSVPALVSQEGSLLRIDELRMQ